MFSRRPIISESTEWVIYALRDPRNFDIRYVGYSKDYKSRCEWHVLESIEGKKSHKCNWIRSLIAIGLKPDNIVLEVGRGASWRDRERYWISLFLFFSENLTNATPGGEGNPGPLLSMRGRPMSEDRKEQNRKALLGVKHTEERREIESEAAKRRCESEDERLRLKQIAIEREKNLRESGTKWTGKGTHHTAQHKLNISEGVKRNRRERIINGISNAKSSVD